MPGPQLSSLRIACREYGSAENARSEFSNVKARTQQPLKISVVHPRDLGPAEIARWRWIQCCNPELGNPFLSPDFTIAVGRVRYDARVAILERDGDIVAFFPYQVRRFGLGLPIGAGLSDCQGMVHIPGLHWDPQHLLRGCGLVVWEFDHLMACQTSFAPHHVVADRSPIVELSDGYGPYIDERQRCSRTVQNALKKRDRAQRELGESRFVFELRDRDALQTLMRWKSGQYRRTGRSDRFSKRWIVQLVEELLDTRAPECTGTLSMLHMGDVAVAGHLGLRSESVLACWFPAYDVAFSKHSPGLLLHLEMARAAASLGIRHLDLGRGDKDYKEVLKTRDIPIAEGWVESGAPVAVIRRFQRAPAFHLRRLVLTRPRLRSTADRTLKLWGGLRSQA
jgi:CelD/BcsL family acetyltransferase involved in cellulose biosynthesis